ADALLAELAANRGTARLSNASRADGSRNGCVGRYCRGDFQNAVSLLRSRGSSSVSQMPPLNASAVASHTAAAAGQLDARPGRTRFGVYLQLMRLSLRM